jgi:hypothetical protein
MRKYLVYLTEYTYYTVPVEALDMDEAHDKLWEMFEEEPFDPYRKDVEWKIDSMDDMGDVEEDE